MVMSNPPRWHERPEAHEAREIVAYQHYLRMCAKLRIPPADPAKYSRVTRTVPEVGYLDPYMIARRSF